MERSLYSKKYQTIRDWLKSERHKQSGLTIRVLAEKLGIHHSIVGKIEQGERKLDIVEYVEYCEAMNIDPLEGIRLITSKASSKRGSR